ncbi:MAG: alanine racemase [Rhodospirillales bacterium]|nr:alanine racemase [Alphaproteobacteria bacterium]MBL6948445.1 alanine racemase [Rhodospirillales bacterium]
MNIDQLSTPTLILDKARLSRNIEAMTARVRDLGVELRPHLKTSKSADVARLAVAGNAGGITVATLSEAEYFFDNGFKDMTYAACIVPSKLERVAALVERGADLKLITDNADVARAIQAFTDAQGTTLKVLVEIDCGEHRTGVLPEGPELLEIAAILDGARSVSLEGVLTHAGHSYACRTPEAMADVAEDERAAVVQAADRLRDTGYPCPTVSAGSTPCVVHARDASGLTEVRPGVYMFGDMFHVGLGTRRVDEIAVSVLASVIAHRKDDNQLYIDAGGLALSKDRATAAFEGALDCGFGLVCDAHTAEPINDLHIESVHQEHGLVVSSDPLPFDRLPIGAKVRVFPNHVCMTAAAYDAYQVVDSDDDGGGTGIIDTWGRCNGW